MAYTTGDIVTRVQQRVRDTGYSSTEIKSYINDTQNDIFNEYRLRFMQTSQNYTLAANTSDITNGVGLPTNYVQALDLTLTSAGDKLLLYRDIAEMDVIYPDSDDLTTHPANVPNVWYFYDDTIRVYPTPNEAYTVKLKYWKKPTLLSADGDVPEIPSEFEEILVVGAAYRVLQVKDNYDQAAILQNKYDEILDKLVLKFSQQQTAAPTLMRINRNAISKTNF